MVVIALTGEPGAGKSTAAKWFAKRGAVIIDADKIVRQLWQGSELPQKAAARWGADIISGGAVDRRAVAARIFTDSGEYRWLCDTIHPLVQAEMERQLPERGIVVAEIPMLFETGRPSWVDRVLFMTADAASRAERNSFRGLDAAEIARREKFFLPRSQRIQMSDWVICNDGSAEDLEHQLESVWSELRRLNASREHEKKGDEQ